MSDWCVRCVHVLSIMLDQVKVILFCCTYLPLISDCSGLNN